MTADKKQRAVNWIAIIGALGAAGGTIVESYRKGYADDAIRITVAKELALYHQWRDRATEDLKMLEAENKQLRENVASLTATVELLASRNKTEARRVAGEVKRALEEPPPAAKPSSDKEPSRIRASRSFEIPQDLIQQQVERMF